MIENEISGKEHYDHRRLRQIFGISRQIRISDLKGGQTDYLKLNKTSEWNNAAEVIIGHHKYNG